MEREIKIITDAISEIVEDSNVINDIKNDLFDIEQRQNVIMMMLLKIQVRKLMIYIMIFKMI